MNAKKFSDAMSELDTKYIDEALSYNSQTTSRHFKRKWTVALIAAILALCLMGAGVAAVKIYIDRVASPDAFENIEHHDLSADGTIQISEYIDNGELFMVPDAMTTNKEEISVTNNSQSEVTVYLYSGEELDESIRELSVGKNETESFTGLSSRFLYHIGITTESACSATRFLRNRDRIVEKKSPILRSISEARSLASTAPQQGERPTQEGGLF